MVLIAALRFRGKGITQILMPVAWLFMALFFGSLWFSSPQWFSVVLFSIAVGLLVTDFLTRPARRARQSEESQ